jgi:RNA polymerase sigma-70 factor (ECF subfamily)
VTSPSASAWASAWTIRRFERRTEIAHGDADADADGRKLEPEALSFSPHLFPGLGHYGNVRVISGPASSAAGGRDVTALVDRARHNDGAAFRELFQAHVAGVHRIVYRMVGPAPDLDDLVQTVFVEAFRSLPAFRGEALFSTWLARIAVRVTMHGVRRRPPRAVVLDDDSEPHHDHASPERTVAAREGLAILDRLLAELRPKRRSAFVLHVLEGYSMEEVAAILNATPAAIKVRVHDARRFIEKRCRRDPRLVDILTAGAQP